MGLKICFMPSYIESVKSWPEERALVWC